MAGVPGARGRGARGRGARGRRAAVQPVVYPPADLPDAEAEAEAEKDTPVSSDPRPDMVSKGLFHWIAELGRQMFDDKTNLERSYKYSSEDNKTRYLELIELMKREDVLSPGSGFAKFLLRFLEDDERSGLLGEFLDAFVPEDAASFHASSLQISEDDPQQQHSRDLYYLDEILNNSFEEVFRFRVEAGKYAKVYNKNKDWEALFPTDAEQKRFPENLIYQVYGIKAASASAVLQIDLGDGNQIAMSNMCAGISQDGATQGFESTILLRARRRLKAVFEWMEGKTLEGFGDLLEEAEPIKRIEETCAAICRDFVSDFVVSMCVSTVWNSFEIAASGEKMQAGAGAMEEVSPDTPELKQSERLRFERPSSPQSLDEAATEADEVVWEKMSFSEGPRGAVGGPSSLAGSASMFESNLTETLLPSTFSLVPGRAVTVDEFYRLVFIVLVSNDSRIQKFVPVEISTPELFATQLRAKTWAMYKQIEKLPSATRLSANPVGYFANITDTHTLRLIKQLIANTAAKFVVSWASNARISITKTYYEDNKPAQKTLESLQTQVTNLKDVKFDSSGKTQAPSEAELQSATMEKNAKIFTYKLFEDSRTKADKCVKEMQNVPVGDTKTWEQTTRKCMFAVADAEARKEAFESETPYLFDYEIEDPDRGQKTHFYFLDLEFQELRKLSLDQVSSANDPSKIELARAASGTKEHAYYKFVQKTDELETCLAELRRVPAGAETNWEETFTKCQEKKAEALELWSDFGTFFPGFFAYESAENSKSYKSSKNYLESLDREAFDQNDVANDPTSEQLKAAKVDTDISRWNSFISARERARARFRDLLRVPRTEKLRWEKQDKNFTGAATDASKLLGFMRVSQGKAGSAASSTTQQSAATASQQQNSSTVLPKKEHGAAAAAAAAAAAKSQTRDEQVVAGTGNPSVVVSAPAPPTPQAQKTQTSTSAGKGPAAATAGAPAPPTPQAQKTQTSTSAGKGPAAAAAGAPSPPVPRSSVYEASEAPSFPAASLRTELGLDEKYFEDEIKNLDAEIANGVNKTSELAELKSRMEGFKGFLQYSEQAQKISGLAPHTSGHRLYTVLDAISNSCPTDTSKIKYSDVVEGALESFLNDHRTSISSDEFSPALGRVAYSDDLRQEIDSALTEAFLIMGADAQTETNLNEVHSWAERAAQRYKENVSRRGQYSTSETVAEVLAAAEEANPVTARRDQLYGAWWFALFPFAGAALYDAYVYFTTDRRENKAKNAEHARKNLGVLLEENSEAYFNPDDRESNTSRAARGLRRALFSETVHFGVAATLSYFGFTMDPQALSIAAVGVGTGVIMSTASGATERKRKTYVRSQELQYQVSEALQDLFSHHFAALKTLSALPSVLNKGPANISSDQEKKWREQEERARGLRFRLVRTTDELTRLAFLTADLHGLGFMRTVRQESIRIVSKRIPEPPPEKLKGGEVEMPRKRDSLLVKFGKYVKATFNYINGVLKACFSGLVGNTSRFLGAIVTLGLSEMIGGGMEWNHVSGQAADMGPRDWAYTIKAIVGRLYTALSNLPSLAFFLHGAAPHDIGAANRTIANLIRITGVAETIATKIIDWIISSIASLFSGSLQKLEDFSSFYKTKISKDITEIVPKPDSDVKMWNFMHRLASLPSWVGVGNRDAVVSARMHVNSSIWATMRLSVPGGFCAASSGAVLLLENRDTFSDYTLDCAFNVARLCLFLYDNMHPELRPSLKCAQNVLLMASTSIATVYPEFQDSPEHVLRYLVPDVIAIDASAPTKAKALAQTIQTNRKAYEDRGIYPKRMTENIILWADGVTENVRKNFVFYFPYSFRSERLFVFSLDNPFGELRVLDYAAEVIYDAATQEVRSVHETGDGESPKLFERLNNFKNGGPEYNAAVFKLCEPIAIHGPEEKFAAWLVLFDRDNFKFRMHYTSSKTKDHFGLFFAALTEHGRSLSQGMESNPVKFKENTERIVSFLDGVFNVVDLVTCM